MTTRKIERKNTNSRLLKNYGSWLYCTQCNKTVAYICYTSYKWLRVEFECLCGSKGGLELKEEGAIVPNEVPSQNNLLLKNNRYCCAMGEEPIFSVVTKQVKRFKYEISCLECGTDYNGIIQFDGK